MYIFLIVIQLLAIVASIFSTVMLLRLRSSVDNKFLFVTALCIDVYAIGYMDEMLCSTAEGIYAALSFEYVGLSFIAFSYFMFVYHYNHCKWMPRWVEILGFGYCLVVAASVQFARYTKFYYRTFDVSFDGFFPHFVTTRTPLYYSFAVYQYALMIGAAVLIAINMKKIRKKTEKQRLLVLLIESLVPIAGLTCTVFLDLKGWDISPFILSILVTSITFTLVKGHFFDVISLAKDDMFLNVTNGVLIAGNTHNLLDMNAMAEKIFPELSTVQAGYDLDGFDIDLFSEENDLYFERNKRYYHSVWTPLYEKRTTVGYVVTINDVTDIQLQMQEMKELKDAADIASEAKSAFLANMSHEIRTPLNAIIGMAELSEKERTESVIREYVSQIKQAGKMLLGIVSDVLDFSKAESGKLELVPAEFDTAEFLNAVINVTNMRIGDKPIDFIVDIDPTIPKKLYGDDVHIRQILMNLLSNAEKFTHSGSITLTIDGKEEGHGYRIFGKVKDTGIGISDADKEKVFSAFQQLDAKKNRKIEGSGLGLAIFAQLVTLMQGTYDLESEYGVGSTFSFNILLEIVDRNPFAHAEREKITVQKVTAFSLYGTAKEIEVEMEKKEAKNELRDYSASAILVVDDNKVNLKVISAFLKHFKIVADTAQSGKEAIEKVQAKDYDLVFMDHMMPEMDGVETTQIIRELDNEHCRKMPIIACTANVVKGVEELFLQAGMDDFVPKPIQLEVLVEKLAKYLDK